jgi:metal-responsive CopG/Arc/MetJ family transcriptional regulator
MNTNKSRAKRKHNVPAITARAQKKIVVDFPEPLYTETENAVAELSTSRSDLIRSAVREFIAKRRQEKLEAELIEGYTANAAIAREVAEELAQFE